MNQSLGKLGLRADNLECPEGGRHDVSTQGLAVAAAKLRNATEPQSVVCLKCRQPVVLRKA